ncbi:MAG: hypothetical protein H7Z37_03480 [Pyrinomonadaceae bacterium]|nr:hypothetical protein [Pyrinomonadaceae bacterium]
MDKNFISAQLKKISVSIARRILAQSKRVGNRRIIMQSSLFTRRKISVIMTAVFCLLLNGFSNVRAEGYQVSPNLQSNQSLSNYKVSGDGKYAVYQIDTFDENFNQFSQLFSVDLASRQVRTLTPNIGGDGKFLGSFQITPDSHNVVYNASLENDANFRSELYIISIAASRQNQRKNIGNIPSNSTADIFNFFVSPDSKHVVYQTSDENEAGEDFRILFRVAIGGGSTTQLTPRVADGNAENVIFAPDSSRIVYTFRSPAIDGTLYQSVSITGTGRKTLTDEISGGATASITLDSKRYVFTADFTPEDDDVSETSLYSITLEGNETRKQLSKTGEEVYNFKFANGFPVIVYPFKLSSAPGFSPTSFGFVIADKSYESVSFNTGKELDSFNFEVSPDNKSVIYLAGNASGATQLYSLTYQNNAGLDQQLSVAAANQSAFSSISDFKIAPNSSRVAFRATQGNAFTPDLFSTPISNNPVAVKLNTLSAENGENADFFGVGSYFITPNSHRIIFGYPPVDGSCCGNDFYTNAIAGGTPGAPFATKANDDSFGIPLTLTADARRIVYTKTVFDENFNSTTSLWTAIVPQ